MRTKTTKCRNVPQTVKTSYFFILTLLGQYKTLAVIMQYDVALISENPVCTKLQIDTDRPLFAGCAVLTCSPQPDVGLRVMLGGPKWYIVPWSVFIHTHTYSHTFVILYLWGISFMYT